MLKNDENLRVLKNNKILNKSNEKILHNEKYKNEKILRVLKNNKILNKSYEKI